MKINIGKNTLGDSDKMSVSLKEYGRSTHYLSSAWRSPMGVGTLVPFMKLIGLPGDTFEIDLDTRYRDASDNRATVRKLQIPSRRIHMSYQTVQRDAT